MTKTVKITSGTTGLNPLVWGTPHRTPRAVMMADLSEDLDRQSRKDERALPEEMDIKIGGGPLLRRNRPPHWNAFNRTKFGTRTIATAGAFVQVDVAPLARKIMRMLKAAAPVRTGHYRASFRYYIGGKFYSSIPTDPKAYTIIGVANIASYASTLDAPRRWAPRPFFKVFRMLRGAEFKDVEVRHGPYLSQKSEEIETKGQRGDKYSGRSAYNAPVIWIGPRGAMADLKHTFRRRRGNRIKRP